MRPAAAFALLLLAGCGGAGGSNEALDTNQIRQLSTPGNTTEDNKAGSASIEPLRSEDLASFDEGAAMCRFLRNGAVLVAASRLDAVARVGGDLRHFVQTTPPDETGIFLEDRQISISIGRTDSAGVAARLNVTNRRAEAEERWAGEWRCT